jgi:hypothetical protein
MGRGLTDLVWSMVCIVLASSALVQPASAQDPGHLCEVAAQQAADRHAVPGHLMRTLTLTETGRALQGNLRPWPWAINHAGKGHWFASRPEMLAFAEDLLASGNGNFDIGCFQINHRWHSAHFASLSDMADPAQNADYAARFLRGKFEAMHSWRAAVGAYHSLTPAVADIYLARFEATFAQMVGGQAPAAAVEPAQPVSTATAAPGNRFPLLVTGSAGKGGSLVPLSGLAGADLIGLRE